MQTIILGFDSFDPVTFERLSSSGKMPNLARFVEAGKYARFTVSDPPQTEVSWTSIATGLDPGGHGIFDFVHRDPATYTPFVSILPTKRSCGGYPVRPTLPGTHDIRGSHPHGLSCHLSLVAGNIPGPSRAAHPIHSRPRHTRHTGKAGGGHAFQRRTRSWRLNTKNTNQVTAACR